jgi:hypothetical protein
MTVMRTVLHIDIRKYVLVVNRALERHVREQKHVLIRLDTLILVKLTMTYPIIKEYAKIS